MVEVVTNVLFGAVVSSQVSAPSVTRMTTFWRQLPLGSVGLDQVFVVHAGVEQRAAEGGVAVFACSSGSVTGGAGGRQLDVVDPLVDARRCLASGGSYCAAVGTAARRGRT
jgi:hypothetical protein